MNASRLILVAAATVLALVPAPQAAAAPDEQFIPVNFPADGPSSRASAAMAAGMMDYLDLLNRRDGGVHGVKFTWQKCDSRYDSSRALECYERAKSRRPAGATLVHPLSTATTYSLIERASADRVPLVSVGYGRADTADGRVFPYIFPLVTTAWLRSAAMVRHLGMRAGGMEKLRGKRLVLLYSDTTDGKDAIPVLSALASKYGYALSTLAVPAPGAEQNEQWLKIREIRPDWLILSGSETMAATALQGAAQAGFPRSRILADGAGAAAAALAGAAGHGLTAAVFSMPGEFPVIAEIRRSVYDAGGGELNDADRLGSLYYNRGVVFGILTAEAVRTAQEHFHAGKPVNAQQAQWGLEHLDIDGSRLEALGAAGLMPPLQTSCADHEGSGFVRFIRWDGRRWRSLTDWLAPLPEDRATVLRMYAESAGAYAKGKGIEPRNCPAG
jgi:branched-chain amino acid transport system substrate-binding protein